MDRVGRGKEELPPHDGHVPGIHADVEGIHLGLLDTLGVQTPWLFTMVFHNWRGCRPS